MNAKREKISMQISTSNNIFRALYDSYKLKHICMTYVS